MLVLAVVLAHVKLVVMTHVKMDVNTFVEEIVVVSVQVFVTIAVGDHAMAARIHVQVDVVMAARAIVKEIVWATVKATARVAAKILVLVVQNKKKTIQINTN